MTTISDFTCYEHSSEMPVKEISTFICPDDQTCDVTLDDFAWVTSKAQMDFTLPEQTKANSVIYKKVTSKSCEVLEAFTQNYNNGRLCSGFNRYCKTGRCGKSMCVG